MRSLVNIKEFINKTVEKVQENNSLNYNGDNIIFTFTDGSEYVMYHSQDCCESVNIEDITGDLKLLEGQVILDAYESSNSSDFPESNTWTFYTIRCNLTTITIRWYGESNGYYSESVDIYRIE